MQTEFLKHAPAHLLGDGIAYVDGIALNTLGEVLAVGELRQRAYSELLRRAAIDHGLLAAEDLPATDGVLSEDASHAIEALLERKLMIFEPSEEECLRHYAARRKTYAIGERVHARHILFAVTPGVDVAALCERAESVLLDLRSHGGKALQEAAGGGRFDEAARTYSNCPTGADGGNLGWLTASNCAPELARELFGRTEVGVLPRLVHSRFGFHIVEVSERQPGVEPPYAEVAGAVVTSLRQAAYVTALRDYLARLARKATIVGVDLDTNESPLIQ